jgi:adenosylcobinamide-GDP ribazoletransferase
LIEDVKIALQFLTRLPIRNESACMSDLPRVAWTFPLVGLLVGICSGSGYVLALAVGLPVTLSAVLAIAMSVALSGALHEDGLADTFDALGGHADRERALSIMRDSRIGTYGALALMLAVALRVSAIASLGDEGSVVTTFLVAASCSRAQIVVTMARMSPARADGLAAGAGMASAGQAVAAAGLASAIAFILLPIVVFLTVMAVAVLVQLAVDGWTKRRLGGFTGDTLGATQQLAEMGCLAALVAS